LKISVPQHYKIFKYFQRVIDVVTTPSNFDANLLSIESEWDSEGEAAAQEGPVAISALAT
jgi:hypothetical protein